MPRPSPEERKRIDANQAAKKRLREDLAARERRLCAQVESIASDALAASKRNSAQGLPDIHIINEKLEKAYCLAVAKQMPTAMVMAAMAQARLAGLVIDRSAVLHAEVSPEQISMQGPIEEVKQRLLDSMIESYGVSSAQAEKMMEHAQRRFESGHRRLSDGSRD